MMRMLISVVLLAILPLDLAAQGEDEQVVLGLSQSSVQITTNFDGSEILIYGAIKRDAPAKTDPPLQVIVTIAGPSAPLTVRRKEKMFGIWMNAKAVDIDSAPSFYAVATSAPWQDVLSNTEDLRHRVSVPRAIRSVGAPSNVDDANRFVDALIRVRMDQGLYQLRENTVELDQQTLFATHVAMPANLTEGDYATRIFLTRGGKVVSQYQTAINVHKVGMERWLFQLSHNQALLYGLLSLAIAVAAGWCASAFFRLIRLS